MKRVFTAIIELIRNLFVTQSMPWSIYESKDSKKRVLICYIISPFYLKKRPIKHANVIESRTIAREFYNLGYSVDVVDYRCTRKINYSKYDVIFGFGVPFSNSFAFDLKLKRICYITGSSPNFSNEREAMRIRDIYNHSGKLLTPRREAYWPWMNVAINSDLMILAGNEVTKSTYKGLNENIKTVPVPMIPSKLKKNNSLKSGFLWFGGAGAVHKGLDLVIDASCEIEEDFSIDICGPLENEKDFFELYKSKIDKKNIVFHGMVDVESDLMQNLIDKNSFIILPSCSEGMASSVTTCMQFGLIPVITKECGIDLGEHSILIEDLTINEVRKAMKNALSMTKDKLHRKKELSIKLVNEINTPDKYEKVFSEAIKSIL